jgi:putative heme-binding domain-containing protein
MIWRFVAFIRSVAQVAPSPVPGDAKHGREVFSGIGGCGGCHAVGGKGADIGPSLTRVGRQRSLEFLREKLLYPDKTTTGGYGTISVTLRDGRTVRGVEKGLDDFSAQLLDVNRKFHSFQRDEVKSIKREARSLMPSDYGQKLSKAEQTDLLAFLASLRGEK